jgi:hypothetical protein
MSGDRTRLNQKPKLEIPGIPTLQNVKASVEQLVSLLNSYFTQQLGFGIAKIQPNDSGQQLSIVLQLNSSGGINVQFAAPEPSIVVLDIFSRDIPTVNVNPTGITIDVEGAEFTIPIES